MSKKWHISYDVKTLELDFRGRVPLALLCRFMQDAAGSHAVALDAGIEKLIKNRMTWMLLKFQMRIKHYPQGSRSVHIETWPSGAESRYAMRDFRFFEEGAEHPFAVATSRWSVIDLDKLRPIRIEEQVLSAGVIVPEKVELSGSKPIRPGGEKKKVKEFNVRLSDLDLNGHVNNVHYIEWIVESVPGDMWRTHEVSEMEVEFRKQVRYGERILSYCHEEAGKNDDSAFMHFLRTDKSKTDVIRARTIRRRAKI